MRLRSKSAREKAFSLVEVLVAILLTGILGGVAVGSLLLALGLYNQTDDYISASEEMESVTQLLAREITHVGLGMPNNRQGMGSFATAFVLSIDPPFMALMGHQGQSWGGPITLGRENPGDIYASSDILETSRKTVDGREIFHGPELYYAWGVPTGVKAQVTTLGVRRGSRMVHNGETVTFRLYPYSSGQSGQERLENFTHDGKKMGLVARNGRNPLSWILFPTLRIPMLVNNIDGNEVNVTLAPDARAKLTGSLNGIEEVHLIQTARLFLNSDNELIQLIFGSDYTNSATETQRVLARNIIGLHFSYDDRLRILTMYVAARGSQRDAETATGTPPGWPDFAPPLAARDTGNYRILVNQVRWRIRN